MKTLIRLLYSGFGDKERLAYCRRRIKWFLHHRKAGNYMHASTSKQLLRHALAAKPLSLAEWHKIKSQIRSET